VDQAAGSAVTKNEKNYLQKQNKKRVPKRQWFLPNFIICLPLS
jgi:hypothetical protein